MSQKPLYALFIFMMLTLLSCGGGGGGVGGSKTTENKDADEVPSTTHAEYRVLENDTFIAAEINSDIAPGKQVTLNLLSSNDGNKFTLDERNTLSFKSAPDYESPGDENTDNIYEIAVTAESDTTPKITYNVQIIVENKNDLALLITHPTNVANAYGHMEELLVAGIILDHEDGQVNREDIKSILVDGKAIAISEDTPAHWHTVVELQQAHGTTKNIPVEVVSASDESSKSEVVFSQKFLNKMWTESAYDQEKDIVYFINQNTVYTTNLLTKEIRVISTSQANPDILVFGSSAFIKLDKKNNRLIINPWSQLITVDINTGKRTRVANDVRGPTKASINGQTNRIYFASDTNGKLHYYDFTKNKYIQQSPFSFTHKEKPYGFTIHGFSIDEETNKALILAGSWEDAVPVWLDLDTFDTTEPACNINGTYAITSGFVPQTNEVNIVRSPYNSDGPVIDTYNLDTCIKSTASFPYAFNFNIWNNNIETTKAISRTLDVFDLKTRQVFHPIEYSNLGERLDFIEYKPAYLGRPMYDQSSNTLFTFDRSFELHEINLGNGVRKTHNFNISREIYNKIGDWEPNDIEFIRLQDNNISKDGSTIWLNIFVTTANGYHLVQIEVNRNTASEIPQTTTAKVTTTAVPSLSLENHSGVIHPIHPIDDKIYLLGRFENDMAHHSIISVDIYTGDTAVVSSNAVGEGPIFTEIPDRPGFYSKTPMVYNKKHDKLFFAEASHAVQGSELILISVSLKTGDRVAIPIQEPITCSSSYYYTPSLNNHEDDFSLAFCGENYIIDSEDYTIERVEDSAHFQNQFFDTPNNRIFSTSGGNILLRDIESKQQVIVAD